MPLTIRPYKDADRDTFLQAVTRIYGDGMPVPADKELPSNRRHYVAMDDAMCVGLYGQLSFDTWRGVSRLKTGGLAMVGVVPERRHLGVGSKLMRFALADMREQGIHLASLYGFSEAYYRQFGYEIAGSRMGFTCPTRQLPKFHIDLPIKQLGPDELHLLRPCYTQFAQARSGLADRDDYLWERLLGKTTVDGAVAYERTAYAVGEPAEGYVLLRHSVNFHVEQEVTEVVWTTPAGYEAVMALLRSIAINKSGVSWMEPSDSPMYFRHIVSAPLSTVSVVKPTMYRLVDVPGAFEQLQSEEEASFTFRVSDPDIPENEGPWLVIASGGKVSIGKCQEADLEFDIRSLTQAFLGEPGIDSVLRHGFATATSRSAVDAFRRLLPPTPVYCLDMF